MSEQHELCAPAATDGPKAHNFSRIVRRIAVASAVALASMATATAAYAWPSCGT